MKQFLIPALLLSFCISCSSKDDGPAETNDTVKWYIKGAKYTGGTITKNISNSVFEVSESTNGLYLYIETDGALTAGVDYSDANANVGIKMDYNFSANSIYDELNYGTWDHIYITENNSEYISGTFKADHAMFWDYEGGGIQNTDHNMENGSFKIYK